MIVLPAESLREVPSTWRAGAEENSTAGAAGAASAAVRQSGHASINRAANIAKTESPFKFHRQHPLHPSRPEPEKQTGATPSIKSAAPWSNPQIKAMSSPPSSLSPTSPWQQQKAKR